MTARQYFEAFDALRDIYLENSWVVDVVLTGRSLRFVLEAVLNTEHPLYHPPRPGEQYCYLAAILTVSSAQPITFTPSGAPPAIDPDGSTDGGNIDVFAEIVPGTWELSGDWGDALVAQPMVSLEPML